MSGARDEILARVRDALSRGRAELARRGVSAPELPSLDASPESLGAPGGLDTQAAHVALFVERVEAVGGRVRRAKSEKEAAAALRSIAGEARFFAVSDAPLAARLADTAFGPRGGRVAYDGSRDELMACRFGVTCAQHAIAETGTLVLRSRDERHRLISLVPDVHIAILRAEDVLPDLRAALLAVKDDPAATFITGPSRTGDIELTLVVGVHGPKELHVILIDA